MAAPKLGFGVVVEATERLQRRLHEHFSEASDLQGVMAVFQLLTAVLLNVAAWTWPWQHTVPCCLAFLAAMLLWHGVFRGPVLSPLPYAVLLLQLGGRYGLGAGPAPRALMLPLVLLATAVNQRALEDLVHEASHHTLYRRAHLNGCAPPACVGKVAPADGFLERAQGLAATLFATLVFKDIEAYHSSHSVHHGFFGNAARDPDTVIYERSRVAGAAGVVRVTLQWYWENLQGALQFVAELARRVEQRLALAVFVTVAAALLNPVLLAALTSVWFVAYFVVLPPLRMVAEQEEHAMMIPKREAFLSWLKEDLQHRAEWLALAAEPERQERLVDELLTKLQWTMSRTNSGWVHRWIFHPCGDGWHAVHHLSPRVPFHQLKRAHLELEACEPIFRALCHRNVALFACAFELVGR